MLPAATGRAGHATAVRQVHPPRLGGQRVPRRPPRPARRQPHRLARHHRRPRSNRRRCRDDPRRPVGHRFGGTAQLREVIDDPDLELVGLFVYSPSKGRRRRRHPGRSPADRRPRDERQVGDPRRSRPTSSCTPRARRSADNTNTDDIVALLESGQERHHHDVVQSPPDIRRRRRRPDQSRVRGGRYALSRRGRAPGLHVRTPRHIGDRTVATGRQDHRAGVRRLLGRSRHARCSST